MRTAGLKMTDAWAHRAQHESGVETIHAEGQEAELSVLVDSVTLKHHSPSRNFRPYLHLTGELRAVRPAVPLAFDIGSVTYDVGNGDRVDAYYEFDDDQLLALTRKGYFVDGFTTPEQITGLEWELPAKVDTLIVAPPAAGDQDYPPVVFVRVHDVAHLQIDLDSSGYDLVEYFADHSGRDVVEPTAATDGQRLRARSDELNSLFKGDAPFEPSAETPGPERDQAQAPSDPTGLQTDFSVIEAELEKQRSAFDAERSTVPGSAEQLYADRVATSLRDEVASSDISSPEPTVDGGDLDFDALEEPATSGVGLEQRKRELSERVADLDHGEQQHEGGIDR